MCFFLRIHCSLWCCVRLHSLALLQHIAVNVIVWQETRQYQQKNTWSQAALSQDQPKKTCLFDHI